MIKNKFSVLALSTFILGSLFFVSSCKKSDDDTSVTPTASSISQITQNDTAFSILAACLTKAELTETLNGTGTFTVFAPNNAAFRASGLANAASLTKAELTPILLYHVLGVKVKSTDLAAKQYVSTLSAGPKSATDKDTKVSLLVRKDSKVTLNGSTASVIKADIEASNGIVHVIDKVITPVTIADLVTNDTDFSSLLAATSKAELATALADKTAKYTVFGPLNDAFTGINLASLSKGEASDIVSTHVISSLNVLASEVSGYTSSPVQSLNSNEDITLAITSGKVYVSSSQTANAEVVLADVQAVNGVVHAINKVLQPTTTK